MRTLRIVVVGSGIVGLATAYQLRHRRPDAEIVVLEKESEIALHQTGRNSGVIHSGIYYKPGSAKALNCRRGRSLLIEFCRAQELPMELCGKLVVATNALERERLLALSERAQANGVAAHWLESDQLKEIEPHAAGSAALSVPDAGIVDYRKVCQRLLLLASARFVGQANVRRVHDEGREAVVESSQGDFRADLVVNCAGLHSDRLCARSGQKPGLQIVPFKGEYYRLRGSAHHLCRHLIYPVADPAFPFLGVHLTRMIDGGIEVGPNAVLALGREAYRKSDLNLRDLFETLTYPGFLKLAGRHVRMGLEEMHRSYSKRAFVRALQRLCPELHEDHLLPSAAGIRAQAVLPTGQLEDDFRIVRSGRVLHVLNAPSPAATAALAIGETLVEMGLDLTAEP